MNARKKVVYAGICIILIAGLGLFSSCFPRSARVTVTSTSPGRPAAQPPGVLSVTLLPNSNVDWATLTIEGPNQRIERRINRGAQRKFELKSGRSYRITLRRVMDGREYGMTRDIRIDPGQEYNLRHVL